MVFDTKNPLYLPCASARSQCEVECPVFDTCKDWENKNTAYRRKMIREKKEELRQEWAGFVEVPVTPNIEYWMAHKCNRDYVRYCAPCKKAWLNEEEGKVKLQGEDFLAHPIFDFDDEVIVRLCKEAKNRD